MLTPPTGRPSKVPVRLTDVDPELRKSVAERLIRTWKLRGLDILKMELAASHPVENPEVVVSQEKAYRVLVERKLPPGPTPKFSR